MEEFVELLDRAWVFLAVLVRVSGVMVVAPVLSSRNIPVMVKAASAALISFVLFPTVAARTGAPPSGMLDMGMVVVQEATVGLALGFVGMLFFSAAGMAGELVATLMDMRFASIALAEESSETSLISTFNTIVAFMLLLAMNGHHWFLLAVGRSYQTVPVGGLAMSGLRSEGLIELFRMVFEAGFRLAAPAIAVLLITNVGLVVLSRAMPQMNIFLVSLPVKLAVGLMAVGLFLPHVTMALGRLFSRMQQDVMLLMGGG